MTTKLLVTFTGAKMRILVAALASFVLSHNAYAAQNELTDATSKALTAGEPAAVVKALDKEVFRGNVVAAQQLGFMYRDGKGVTQDYAKARKLLQTAAEPNGIRIWYKHGLGDSQYALAVMLRDGIGGKPDASGAETWFKEAAEKGRAQAQLALAQMYFKGAGIKRNPERAFMWSSIAATRLTEAAQTEAVEIRDQAQKQLASKQLANVGNLVNKWKPRAE
jgi:TPR repeat protein